MKRAFKEKRTAKCGYAGYAIHNGVDSSKWATKMEIHSLFSGKPDLKINKSGLEISCLASPS